MISFLKNIKHFGRQRRNIMKYSQTMKHLRALLSIVFSVLLLCFLWGCGSGPDTTPTPTPTPAATYTLTTTLSSNTVMFGAPVTATATLKDASGAAVGGVVVSFAATSNLVVFDPVSATALTNPGGAATVNVDAASAASAGATTITASATVVASGETITVTSQGIGISVRAAGGGGAGVITLGAVTFGTSPISAYGTTSVSVPVLIDGAASTVPISVTFNSTCVANGKATITTPVTSNTVTGIATSTYRDNNCNDGTDTITATVTGAAPVSKILTVTLPATNNIQFISATPEIIATQTVGSATLPKSSLVKFKVVDNNNNGKKNVDVDFSIISNVLLGGITFDPVWARSDAEGFVTTSVTSGTVPTPVWVVATVRGSAPVIKSQSNMLTITTGLPAQNGFSFSVGTFNIEAWNIDGITTSLTIIASDRLGNAVPDGTAINFISPESGKISPASCTTTSGTCSTTFTSSGVRPTDGRVTVLTYAVGEKSFVDNNGNNIFDAGDTFYDLGDLYVDVNENGQWDAGEQFFLPSSGNLSGCPDSILSKQGTCSGEWGINYTRRSAVLVMSGSGANLPLLAPPYTLGMGSLCTRVFTTTLADLHGNAMPAGTTIVTANNDVQYQTDGFLPGLASVDITGGSPVENTASSTGTIIAIKVNGGTACTGTATLKYPQGTVDIVVTTPKGKTTTFPFTITGTTLIPAINLAPTGPLTVTKGDLVTLTATITDQFGVAIPKIKVSFELLTKNSGGTLSKTSVTTNNFGQAVTFYTAGPNAGAQKDIIAASILDGSTNSNLLTINVNP